jgi:hypothetical protein
MYTQKQLDEYMSEIREHVCSRCIERPPNAPPCGPHGKQCGIELPLPDIIEVCHRARSHQMDPYIERFHEDVCSHCANRTTDHCPCPLDSLLWHVTCVGQGRFDLAHVTNKRRCAAERRSANLGFEPPMHSRTRNDSA